MDNSLTVSVIVPCKNEKGTIERIVTECPLMGANTEIIFVAGPSHDGTLQEMYRVQQKYSDKSIIVLEQKGIGKANAVHTGFAHASGDLLIILDGDCTVLPADLIKFYTAYITKQGDFINGSRLVYPQEKGAMPFLNYLANLGFVWLFRLLLKQPLTDTLCGTKMLSKSAYKKIMSAPVLPPGKDPFGDFELLLNAVAHKLKIIDVPIYYKRRTYGVSQIRRFYHGIILLKLFFHGFWRIKVRN